MTDEIIVQVPRDVHTCEERSVRGSGAQGVDGGKSWQARGRISSQPLGSWAHPPLNTCATRQGTLTHAHSHQQMGSSTSPVSRGSDSEYHQLCGVEEEQGCDDPPHPTSRLLPGHAAHAADAPRTPWEWVEESDSDQEYQSTDTDEGLLHFLPPAPLFAWTAAHHPKSSSPVTHENQEQRYRRWLELFPRVVMFPPPVVKWLPKYTRHQFWGDLLGGLTVAVMVIPQGMSYAVLAELPPVYGLFCAVSGPLVYTFLGSSRHISIGPVALVSLSLPRVYDVLYPDLLSLPEEEASAVRVHAALSIAFVSGVVLSALGLFRLGLIAHLIPPAVMVGFTNAAALAIGVSQIKEVLGLQGVPRFDYTWQSGWYVLRHLGDGQAASAGVGLGCIVFLLAAKQLRKRFMQRAPPAGTGVPRRFLSVLKALYPLLSLVLVIVTSLVARLLLSRGVEIIIVKDVPAGLPSPAAPRLDRFWTIVEHSLGVVLVAFMEAYAVAKKYALQEGYYLNVNRELLSLGAANLGASFFSSYPVSGSFSRSAVSYSAGTQTQLANAISAVCVMMVLSFFAQFFYYLPRATLGAIIEVALLNLLDFESMRREYRRSKLDAIVAFVTFSITLAFDTELGLLGGISASALLVYWMPRGGAFITRLYVRPRFRRHDKCSICVIDLPRLLLSPTWAQRRLTDYLKSARRSGGAAGMLVILSWHEKWKDEEKSGRDDKVSWEARRRNGQMDEHRVQAMIQRAMEAADAAGVPREMTTIVGLPLPGKSCQSADLSLLVTEGQRKVAENVLRRASSISLLAAYGEELMTDLLTR